MASELVALRPNRRTDVDVVYDVAALESPSSDAARSDAAGPETAPSETEAPSDVAPAETEVPDPGCVVCGEPSPEPGACCSSRCAGEAQRQLRRNAARLRRLELRDANDRRRNLTERNGRLMSAILRWRPEAHDACSRAHATSLEGSAD